MTIDPSAIKVGDVVTVRARVVAPTTYKPGRILVCSGLGSESFRLFVGADDIATHEPAPPKPLEVGDIVQCVRPLVGAQGVGLVVAIYGSDAWVRWTHNDPSDTVGPLTQLERAP